MIDRLRIAWEKQGLALGVHCPMTDLMFYEMAGRMGYDFVWIEGEHTDLTGPMIFNGILATQAGGAAAFVRVPSHDPALVKPILDGGADGIIFPMVNTAEQAKQVAQACRYYPLGNRSFGPGRGMNYGMIPLNQYLEHAEKNVCCFIQIETKEAVENLDEILQVDGITACICGAMDLSLSVGKLGQMDDPEVQDLMMTMINKCKAAQKPFGVSSAADQKLLDLFVSHGASLICMGSPDVYFMQGAQNALCKYRSVKNNI